MRRSQTYALAAMGLLLPACVGAIAGGGNGGNNGNGGNGPLGGGGNTGSGGAVPQPASAGLTLFTDQTLCQAGQLSVGSTPMRRLSRVEYNNMVRDLGLGDSHPADQFVSEQKIPGNFNSNSYAAISGTLISQQYLQAAEALASAAVTGTNLTNLVSCASQANAACAQQFIADFANRAFRGQLDSTESAALLQLYTDVSTQFDFPTGIQAVVTSVLTSPRFLFVLEFGQTGASATATAIPLSPLEVATRLSLYLWRSLPDAALIQAANAGQLATAAQVATQATRMLADAKATAALQDFADQWLDVENMNAITKDTQFTTWTPAVAQALHTETLTTFSSTVLATSNNGLTDLLTSPYSYVNQDLTSAGIYGDGVSASGSAFARTMVNAADHPRTGILTDAGVLAIHAHTSLQSPVLRGRLVRQQILCEQVPEPPAAVGGVPIPPPPSMLAPGDTTRSKYVQHTTNPNCSVCHQYMDPIGFAFDNYDATGAFGTTENGTTIDATGSFVAMGSGDITGSFNGAADMIQQLAASPQVDQCFTLEQLRYALGRVESNADACSAQQIYQAFSSSTFNLQQLLVAVVQSDAFRYRTPVNAGSACQ
jgi:hypothetical protein